MRALSVDFAPPSPWPARALYFVALCMLGLALWQGVIAWRSGQRLVSERAATAATSRQLQAARARLASAARPSAPAYARDARTIARAAAFDVGAVLRAIESAQIVGAKVASIAIDSRRRSADLVVDVAGPEVASTYVQALDAGDPHPAWTLVRLQTQGPKSSAEIQATFP